MGGSNSKNAIFDEDPKNYTDILRDDYRLLYENSWRIEVDWYETYFCIKAHGLYLHYQTYEVVYQIIYVNKHNLRRKKVIRGVEKLRGADCFYSDRLCNVRYKPNYNQFNFQALTYAVIENNGLRQLNFEDENVYGKSITVLTTGGSLKVPIQFINMRAPLLARHFDKKKSTPKLNSTCLEVFFQVFHGVHVQLEVKEIKALLNISANFQVLNVKRYCEHQLIWRDDFEFSEKQKFKMACKYDLNILMYQVLRNVKSVEELSKLASIAIKMNRLGTNISKLLIAKMFKIA